MKNYYATLVIINSLMLLFMVYWFFFKSDNIQVEDEITTQRINIVEPDGTLRMTLSNNSKLPGIYTRGKETPFDRPQAGIIFHNDEGSEIGGLIFGGYKDANGKIVNSGGSLTFDKYEANQIVQLAGVDDSENQFAGLIISEIPEDNKVNRRIWVGRTEDGVASIVLKDSKGNIRISLEVDAAGSSNIHFYDEKGTIIKSLNGENKN